LDIFARFGELILKLFSFVGMVILAIPKIPQKIRNINTSKIREKIDTESVKENISKLKSEVGNVKEEYTGNENISQPSTPTESTETIEVDSTRKTSDSEVIYISGMYTSEEKERTVLNLQIASAFFIVLSILVVFNFLNLIIYLALGGITVAFVIYMLFYRVKKMYPKDFNAYRDFFLMYLAVGIIIILISGNSSLIMAFSFQTLPSLSILIYAMIAVAAVFLIFRIRYHRDFTYGVVWEAGKKTAHVKVEYDIRSNVKPDLYLVKNNMGALEGDSVKLKIEEKIISTGGNKPLEIIEVFKKI
jgi:uncharacterized membrane protein